MLTIGLFLRLIVSGWGVSGQLVCAVARHGLTRASRFLVLRTRISDRPGALAALLARIAERRVNVVSVDHHREGMDLPVTGTAVELTLSTRDEEQCDELLGFLAEWGYEAERVR